MYFTVSVRVFACYSAKLPPGVQAADFDIEVGIPVSVVL